MTHGIAVSWSVLMVLLICEKLMANWNV